MTFNWTVDVGNVITVVLAVCGVVVVTTRRLDRMEHKLGMMWAWFKKVHHINGDTETEPE